MSGLGTETWGFEREDVWWEYELPVREGQLPVEVMAGCGRVLPGLLDGFAVLGDVAWGTFGDDLVVDRRGAIDDGVIEARFRELPDVCWVAFELDLVVTCADGVEEVAIVDGGRLLMKIEGARLVLHVQLHADIHAERTRGSTPDNTTLARLNGPRLTAFLARVRTATGARFIGNHARRLLHRHYMSAHGFHQTLPNPTLRDILEALDAGRLVHFTDYPPDDPRPYVLLEQNVEMRRAESSGFQVTTEVIAHDGSCVASRRDHETDDPTAEITTLLNQGDTVTLK